MKKIPTVFVRDPVAHRVTDEITPGCEWLAEGKGFATRKWDGTCCRVSDGKLWKRYELKPGRSAPNGFVSANGPDAITGKQPGWVPVSNGPDDKWHREAYANGLDSSGTPFVNGVTYELCGPKVQGDPEELGEHVLIRHGNAELPRAPREFRELGVYLLVSRMEGIVWHDHTGPIGKLKAKDFGHKRCTTLRRAAGDGVADKLKGISMSDERDVDAQETEAKDIPAIPFTFPREEHSKCEKCGGYAPGCEYESVWKIGTRARLCNSCTRAYAEWALSHPLRDAENTVAALKNYLHGHCKTEIVPLIEWEAFETAKNVLDLKVVKLMHEWIEDKKPRAETT